MACGRHRRTNLTCFPAPLVSLSTEQARTGKSGGSHKMFQVEDLVCKVLQSQIGSHFTENGIE